MKLLSEHVEAIEPLTEQTSDGKVLYLQGVYIQSEKKNRNGRIYPREIMEEAVDKYQKEYINERRALGELNHPDRPFVDPAEAAIMIESLDWQGDNVVGKARVLNTPKGNIIKALMEANFKMGVSTRGLGEVKEKSDADYVTKYVLNAIDAVDKPSGQVCYVNALQESTEWVMENGVWVQKTDQKKFEKLFLESFRQMLDDLKKANL